MDRRPGVAVHPEDHHAGAHAGRLDRLREDAADGIDDHVGAGGHQLGALGGPLVGGEHGVRPHGPRDRRPLRARLDRHDLRRTGCPKDGDEQAADRAGPEHDGRLTRPDAGAVGAVHHARQGLDERRQLGRNGVRDRVDAVGRGGHEAGQRPVAMDPESHDVGAVRRTSGAAGVAPPALGVRVDDDAGADRGIADGRARGPDPADELVADDDRRRGRVTRRHVDDLDVRAAHAARLDLDEDLVGPGRRVGNVPDDEPALSLEYRGTHQLDPPVT